MGLKVFKKKKKKIKKEKEFYLFILLSFENKTKNDKKKKRRNVNKQSLGFGSNIEPHGLILQFDLQPHLLITFNTLSRYHFQRTFFKIHLP